MALHHAALVLRASEAWVADESDRSDIRAAYELLVALSNDMWEG